MIDRILFVFIAPGEIVADLLGITREQNRDLVRMLINSLFWIMVVVIGLIIWTSSFSIYQ